MGCVVCGEARAGFTCRNCQAVCCLECHERLPFARERIGYWRRLGASRRRACPNCGASLFPPAGCIRCGAPLPSGAWSGGEWWTCEDCKVVYCEECMEGLGLHPRPWGDGDTRACESCGGRVRELEYSG
jgi:hypothetical protein